MDRAAGFGPVRRIVHAGDRLVTKKATTTFRYKVNAPVMLFDVSEAHTALLDRSALSAISQGNLFIASYHYGSSRSRET